MIINRFISLCALLTITGTVAAGVVKVDLNTGTINPGNAIVISLNDLQPNHTYTLSCVLTSNHAANKPLDLVQVTTPTNSTALVVNAEQTAPNSHQYQIPSDKNTYITGDITKDIGDITIVNLESTDSLLLSSCHAVGHF